MSYQMLSLVTKYAEIIFRITNNARDTKNLLYQEILSMSNRIMIVIEYMLIFRDWTNPSSLFAMRNARNKITDMTKAIKKYFSRRYRNTYKTIEGSRNTNNKIELSFEKVLNKTFTR